MTIIPSLDTENAVPLRYEFVCTGFAERIASWTRFLCLSFLFLQLFASVANLLYPFAIDPPLFFNQLLFFLLACAAFETLAVPIEVIKVHTVIDLQKLMVVKVYYRYFFTQVRVLAPFDKISALGVSARPTPILKGLFSRSVKRYALLMLTETSELFRLNDYNLGLEEANKLVQELQMHYLRNAQIVTGSENMELYIDEMMITRLVPRPCHRSALSLIDGAVMPVFQAGISSFIVAVLIAATAVFGNFLSDQLFNTNLKISNQPVFQLLLASGVPDPEPSLPLTPPDSPPPVDGLAALHNKHEATVTASEPAVVYLAEPSTEGLQIAALPDTVSQTTEPVASIELQAADLVASTAPELPSNIAVALNENKPEPDESMPLLENIGSVAKVASGSSEKSTPNKDKGPAKTAVRLASVEPFLQKPARLVAIPSRIPSFDETSILSDQTRDSDTKEPESPFKIIIPTIAVAPVSENEGQKQASEINPAVRAKRPIAIEENIRAKVNPITQPGKQPDSGRSVAAYLGQKVQSALDTLGKPLTTVNSSRGSQLIYSGITLQTDAGNELIMQVNLTSAQSRLLGNLATPEGISVGSPVREARIRLGIPLEKSDSPGLHFPGHGISIYPLPGDPETIGSIKLYQIASPKKN